MLLMPMNEIKLKSLTKVACETYVFVLFFTFRLADQATTSVSVRTTTSQGTQPPAILRPLFDPTLYFLIPQSCSNMEDAVRGFKGLIAKTRAQQAKKNSVELDSDDMWASRFKQLSMCLAYMLYDAFFRRLTFDHAVYRKEDHVRLADSGIFNTCILNGSYTRFGLHCAFCDFSYCSDDSVDRKTKLNVMNVMFLHAQDSPTCESARSKRNIPFQDNYTRLGLHRVNMKFRIRENKMEPLNSLYLDSLTLKTPIKRMRCSTCLSRERNVLFSCNHCSICTVCLSHRKNKSANKCTLCREPTEFYVRVSLPSSVPSLTNTPGADGSL